MTDDTPDQLSRADLAGMSAEAIVQAKAAGRLDRLLSEGDPAATAAARDRAQVREYLRGMSPDQITAARKAGALDPILNPNHR